MGEEEKTVQLGRFFLMGMVILMRLGSLLVTLGLDITTFQGRLNAATLSVETFGGKVADEFEEMERKIIDTVRNIGLGMMALSSVAGMGLKKFIDVAADFEQEMSKVKAVSGANVAQMELLEQQAIAAGEATVFSAGEAAKAQGELLKAGLSLEQVLSGGLEGALVLASAGELDLASAASIASTALNTFSKDGLTVGKAADILAGAANASATDVNKLRLGLSMAGTVASGAGMSFRDTATALAVFAQNGLDGSDAGTSFKTMLMNLIPKTKEQTEIMRKLGLVTENGTSAFYDQNGNLRDLASIAELVKLSLKGLTAEQRSSYLETMFGTDAIRAGNIMYKEGAEGVRKMQAEMSKTTAAQVAAEKINNLKGAIEELSGSVESVKLAIGDTLIPPIKLAVRFLEFIADSFNRLPKYVKSTVGALLGIGIVVNFLLGAFLMLFAIMLKLSLGFYVLRLGGLRLVGILLRFSVGYVAAKAIGALTTAFTALRAAILTNPITVVIMAVVAALGYLAYRSGLASKWIDRLTAKLVALGILSPKIAEASMAEGIRDAASVAEDLNKMLEDNARTSKDAAKNAKKFLAAFDEVYSIPDKEDELDLSGGLGGKQPGEESYPGGVGKTSPTEKPDDDRGLSFVPPAKRPNDNPPTDFLEELIRVYESAREKIRTVLDSLTTRYQQVVDLFNVPVIIPSPALQPGWNEGKSVLDTFRNALTQPWPVLSPVPVPAMEPGWSASKGIIEVFRQILVEIWPTPEPVPVPEVSPFQTTIQTALETVKGFWENHKTSILLTAGLLVTGIVLAFTGLPGAIVAIIGRLVMGIGPVLARIGPLFQTALANLPRLVSGVIPGIISAFSGMASRISSTFSSLVSTVGSWLSGLASRASSAISSAVSRAGSFLRGESAIPAYASGTNFHPGGWAIVGENGPELLNLPRGSSVTPNSSLPELGGGSSGGVGGIDYGLLASAIVDALQGANFVAKIDTSNRNMTQLTRALQPAMASENARRG